MCLIRMVCPKSESILPLSQASALTSTRYRHRLWCFNLRHRGFNRDVRNPAQRFKKDIVGGTRNTRVTHSLKLCTAFLTLVVPLLMFLYSLCAFLAKLDCCYTLYVLRALLWGLLVLNTYVQYKSSRTVHDQFMNSGLWWTKSSRLRKKI